MSLTFYHTQGETPAEADAVLPALLEKALAVGEGGTILVVAPTAERVRRLDEFLWGYEPTSFMPHARVHTPAAAHCRIHVATPDEAAAEQVPIRLVLGGAEAALPTAPLPPGHKVGYVFEGSANRLETARRIWKNLKASGLSPGYVQHTPQGWQRKS